LLATGGGDGCRTLKLWRIVGPDYALVPFARADAVHSIIYHLAFAPQGDLLVSLGSDHVIKLWQLPLSSSSSSSSSSSELVPSSSSASSATTAAAYAPGTKADGGLSSSAAAYAQLAKGEAPPAKGEGKAAAKRRPELTCIAQQLDEAGGSNKHAIFSPDD
jgi:hypothetical protein